MATSKTSIQPLDRVAIAFMVLLTLLIGFMIFKGDVVAARVREFTWENQQIGADDTSFTLNFSRPMDIKSVEKNLKIEPPLAGKISWAGRRMVYTLLTPAPYGTNYEVRLQDARDRFAEQEGKNRVIQPFTGNFRSRDRVIIYIG
ncbi:Ig-like domain-containing protein, partial [Nodularia spumigena CS-587/03]|nr:Ig-like domain-containing protein [Nodularia spumigena CS-587/03]